MKIEVYRHTSAVILLFVSQLVVLAVLSLVYISYLSRVDQPEPAPVQMVQDESTLVEGAGDKLVFEPLDSDRVQAAIDSIDSDFSGSYSLHVYDPIYEEVVVEAEADRVYFIASLHKLFLAFLAWQDVDKGILDSESQLLNHPQRGPLSLRQCLDLMIRVSDSPCHESLLARYNYDDIQKRLDDLGLEDINSEGFLTSARAMSKLNTLIFEGQDLSQKHHQALLSSMNLQIYQQGLQQSFSSETNVVYDKVGFSSVDWHDVGFVLIGEEARPVVISILTDGAGSDGVARLANAIRGALLDPASDDS